MSNLRFALTAVAAAGLISFAACDDDSSGGGNKDPGSTGSGTTVGALER